MKRKNNMEKTKFQIEIESDQKNMMDFYSRILGLYDFCENIEVPKEKQRMFS